MRVLLTILGKVIGCALILGLAALSIVRLRPAPPESPAVEKIPAQTRAAPAPARRSLQVLFIGNSFSFGENLPKLVASMSSGSVQPLLVEISAFPSFTLVDHAKNQSTLKVLATRNWDYVILQDCSNCPIQNRELFRQGIYAMVKKVREAEATPLLFMTWADEGRPKDQELIAKQYYAAGEALHVSVIPVGVAWQRALSSLKQTKLHANDQHHSGPNGAMLSAYTILSCLTPISKRPEIAAASAGPLSIFGFLRPKTEPPNSKLADSLFKIARSTTAGAPGCEHQFLDSRSGANRNMVTF